MILLIRVDVCEIDFFVEVFLIEIAISFITINFLFCFLFIIERYRCVN
jgi:hypothetical protein